MRINKPQSIVYKKLALLIFVPSLLYASSADAMNQLHPSKDPYSLEGFTKDLPLLSLKAATERYNRCTPEVKSKIKEHFDQKEEDSLEKVIFNIATKLPREIQKQIINELLENPPNDNASNIFHKISIHKALNNFAYSQQLFTQKRTNAFSYINEIPFHKIFECNDLLKKSHPIIEADYEYIGKEDLEILNETRKALSEYNQQIKQMQYQYYDHSLFQRTIVYLLSMSFMDPLPVFSASISSYFSKHCNPIGSLGYDGISILKIGAPHFLAYCTVYIDLKLLPGQPLIRLLTPPRVDNNTNVNKVLNSLDLISNCISIISPLISHFLSDIYTHLDIQSCIVIYIAIAVTKLSIMYITYLLSPSYSNINPESLDAILNDPAISIVEDSKKKSAQQ